MTFSYSPSLTTNADKVRLLIGDTNGDDILLQNEEINYFLGLNPNPTKAAVLAARAVASKFSRLADTTIETVSVRYSQKAKQYLDLASSLEMQASSAISGGMSGPSATGISNSAIETARDDTDRPTPDIEKGMFNNPPETDPNDPRME